MRFLFPRFPGGKFKAVSFSYDDGMQSDKKLIKILDEHYMFGTFNINSGNLAGDEHISEAEISETYKNHEVAMHGLTHAYFDAISPAQISAEVCLDKANLERLTGKITRGLAYPYSATKSASLYEILKNSGVAYARGGHSKTFDIPTDFYMWEGSIKHKSELLFDMANDFLGFGEPENNPYLFTVQGHTMEFEANNNWDRMEKLADLLAGKEDIWYATFIKICDYLSAFRSLITSSDGKILHNFTSSDIWFTADRKPYFIGAGKTLILQ